MLIPVTDGKLVPSLVRACGFEPVFGSGILTALRAYGIRDPRARFWVQMDAGKEAAALYLAGDVLMISAAEHAEASEVADLIRAENVRETDTNWAQCAALQKILGGTTESSFYMVYTGGTVEGAFPEMQRGEPETVFEVLQRSHEYYRTHLTFETWSANLRQKLERGLMESYQLSVDGEVIGAGSIASEDDGCACIAAVAVVPEHRHRGWGSYISRFLVQRIQEKGKTPRLISGYDEVAELYRKIGFEPCGRWGELYL